MRIGLLRIEYFHSSVVFLLCRISFPILQNIMFLTYFYSKRSIELRGILYSHSNVVK